jgi:hypothetical protein
VTTSSHYQSIAEEAILDHFRTPKSEPFHSDDLWHVIPDEHRGVISLAVMALVNKKLIVGCGYRKSAIPSRKRSPSQEYRLTELGRDRVRAGVGTNNREGTSGSHRLESTEPSTGLAPGARSSVGVDPGVDSSVVHEGAAEEEPARTEQLPMLPEVDPEAWAA